MQEFSNTGQTIQQPVPFKKEVRTDAFRTCIAAITYMLVGELLMNLVFDLLDISFPDNSLSALYWNTNSGFGDILVTAVSLTIILFLFHKWNPELWKSLKKNEVRRKRMTFFTILFFISVDFTLNAIAGFLDPLYESFFNLFGMTSSAEQDIATASVTSFTGILYGDFLAPIFEETIFRGLIRQSLMKYGKWFAIFTSALLFGIMHGNIAQFLSAFLGGILYGYVATEYSIRWSIFLHIFWNGFVGDLISFSESYIPELAVTLYALGLLVLGAIYLISHIRKMAAYRKENAPEKGVRKYYYTSPWFFILLAVCAFQIVYGLTALS